MVRIPILRCRLNPDDGLQDPIMSFKDDLFDGHARRMAWRIALVDPQHKQEFLKRWHQWQEQGLLCTSSSPQNTAIT